MKDSLKIIGIILATFALAFITSLLLELELVRSAWIRMALVYLLVIFELAIGAAAFWISIQDLKRKR